MASEAKQRQRFMMIGGKRFCLEQHQSMVVIEPKDLDEYLTMVYQMLKSSGVPVIDTVCYRLAEIAAKDCGTYTEAARALGMSYRRYRYLTHKEDPCPVPKYTRLRAYIENE